MEKAEYRDKLRQKLNSEQLALFSFVWYYNPDFVDDVYIPFQLEQYEEVLDFVDKNKDHLTLKNVPRKFKKAARANIKAGKALSRLCTATAQ